MLPVYGRVSFPRIPRKSGRSSVASFLYVCDSFSETIQPVLGTYQHVIFELLIFRVPAFPAIRSVRCGVAGTTVY